MQHLKRLGSLVFALSFSLTPLAALAAATSTGISQHPLVPSSGQQSAVQPSGLSSCFDHYRFGSVFATLSSSLTQVSSGAPISFMGTVTNDNVYPVNEVSVYAKVMQNRSATKDVNGPDVVAFIPIVSHLAIPAKSSQPLAYSWTVPADALSGEYRLVTYVVSYDRFNLSGLSFTDDVTGNSADFTVVGQQKGSVRFDKDSVMVNGQPFHFAAFPPTVPNGAPSTPVSASVGNTTDAGYTGTITWKLYSWDGLQPSKLIDTKQEDIAVQPHASTTVSYTAPLDTPSSVYFLTGEFTTKDGSTSFINLRFAEQGVNIPRLNDVGVDNGMAFACIHSMGSDVAPNGRVEMSVHETGVLGSVLALVGLGTLADVSYSGTIPGDIYALAAPLKKASGSYQITAKLYQNDKLLDSVTVPYCANGASKCDSNLVTLLVGLALLILLIALIVFIVLRLRARRRGLPPTWPPTAPPIA